MSAWSGVAVVSGPSTDAITVEKLKARLRIDYSDDDGLLGDLIKEATARIDGPNGIGVAMIEQTWRKAIDHFPHTILLPGAPVRGVDTIRYVDTEGTEQTLDPSKYRVDVDSEPARVEPVFGMAWPATRHVIGAVKVEYVVGKANAADVPRDLITAVYMLVGHLYENREAVAHGTMAATPLGFEWIVADHRRGALA